MTQPLEIHYEDDEQLYRSYMPYVSGGGLFIKTNIGLGLGDVVTLQVTLPDGMSFEAFKTQVIWVMPGGVESGVPLGVGVRIMGGDAGSIQTDIEHILASFAKLKKPTDTI